MMLDDDEFTFAAVSPLSVADGGGGGGGGGGVFLGALYYPVFGRPRSPPRPQPEPEPEPEPETATATVRVPLAQLLLADREPSSAPAQPPPDDELDSVPAELYCPWSPGWAAGTAAASPARCRKSSSTGSSFLRWRPSRLVGRSQSDGKEKFVFLSTRSAASASRHNSKGRNGGEGGGGSSGHAWSYYAKGSGSGGAGVRRTTFLPYKQDLVGLFANAAVFRRSYHPF